jgi:hypothetical protein
VQRIALSPRPSRHRSPALHAHCLRTAALCLSLLCLPALAQTAGGYTAGPGLVPPDYTTEVISFRPSPPATQDRQFTLSRFWRLDPGRYEVELWWQSDAEKHGEGWENTLKAEIEIGLSSHIQLDLYLNFGWATGTSFDYQGTSMEMRYSISSVYNAIPWNPVLYFEFTTRKNAQDRAEFRLLAGGDLPWGGLWASNFFIESNIDYFNESYSEGADLELGVTASVNFPVVKDWLRLGAELRAGFDEHGTTTLYGNFQLGPEMVIVYRPANLKLTASALFGVCSQDPLVRLYLIAGWQF